MSLTYDDALPSQLACAAPDLDAHGLLGTFFLTDARAAPEPWRALRSRGHELAAHTLRHPCSRSNAWVKPGDGSEDYTLARLAGELDEQVAMLDALGQPRPFTFAYPCGETAVGAGHESYVPLIKERFLAARGAGGASRGRGSTARSCRPCSPPAAAISSSPRSPRPWRRGAGSSSGSTAWAATT